MTGSNLTKNTAEEFLDLASRHRKSQRDHLIKRVKMVLKKQPAVIYNKASKLAREFYLRGREVMGEYHRLNAFIRFEVYPEYLLVSEIQPEHDIVDLMFNYFRRRYPDFVLLFLDLKRGYLSTRRTEIQFPAFKFRRNYWYFPRKAYTLIKIREILKPQITELLNMEEFSSETWERYYDSQYIETRKNIKLARKALPQKMMRKAGGGLAYEARRLEEEEKNRQKNSLLDFI